MIVDHARPKLSTWRYDWSAGKWRVTGWRYRDEPRRRPLDQLNLSRGFQFNQLLGQQLLQQQSAMHSPQAQLMERMHRENAWFF